MDSSAVSWESEFGSSLGSYSEMRRNLEASVLPLAISVDGRRFSLQTSLYGLQLQAGGYVVLEGDGVSRLGRVLTLELDRKLSTELDAVGPRRGRPGYLGPGSSPVRAATASSSKAIQRHFMMCWFGWRPGRRCRRGCSAAGGPRRSCASASSYWRLACPAWRTPAVLTGTHSCAVSRGQVRPTRSG
jgi:hypothetical protein